MTFLEFSPFHQTLKTPNFFFCTRFLHFLTKPIDFPNFSQSEIKSYDFSFFDNFFKKIGFETQHAFLQSFYLQISLLQQKSTECKIKLVVVNHLMVKLTRSQVERMTLAELKSWLTSNNQIFPQNKGKNYYVQRVLKAQRVFFYQHKNKKRQNISVLPSLLS